MHRRLIALATLALAATALGQPEVFEVDGGTLIRISGNGKAAAGFIFDEKVGFFPARWTPAGGFEQLSELQGFATAISFNGDFVAGMILKGDEDSGVPFIWSDDDGFTLIPAGPLINDDLAPTAISFDGDTIVAQFGSWQRSTGVWTALPSDCELNPRGEDLSPDGRFAVGFCEGDPPQILRWEGLDSLPLTVGDGIARAMSDDGSVIHGFTTIDEFNQPFRWREDDGFEILQPLPGFDGAIIMTGDAGGVVAGGFSSAVGAVEATLWFDGVPVALQDIVPGDFDFITVKSVSADGMQILSDDYFINLDPSSDADADGDGLRDYWETTGIPYLSITGGLEHYVLENADPLHKTLYVEIDHMDNLTIDPGAVDDIEFAFEIAPVPNPDGFEGIDLFIEVDEGDIPGEVTTPTPNNNFPASAKTIKLTNFGTKTERMDPNVILLLQAKRKAYRYGIAYAEASTDIGGLGELEGDDFVVFIKDYDPEDQAAVIMHELGHNLGLRHGGIDSINGKPNYPSIMNYVLSYEESWNETFWRLDYSRAQLQLINESDLSELDSVGIGGGGLYDDFFMPFYGIVADGAPCYDPSLFGEPIVSYADLDPAVLTDLNLDCDTDDESFAGDLNFLDSSGLPGSVDPSPGQILLGHDDWSNLVYAISSAGGAFAGPAPDDELTDEQRQLIRDTFPPPVAQCAADINGDGQLSILDFVAFQYAWQLQDPIADCNGDATFNILDFVCYQQLFQAGCP